MNPQLTGVLQIALPVQDIERATAFYRGVLELRLLFSGPNVAFFDCGGVRLYLACGEGAGQPGGNLYVYFRTTSVDKQLSVLIVPNQRLNPIPTTRSCASKPTFLCGR